MPRRAWVRGHCGMEAREQDQRLAAWKVPAFKEGALRKQREAAQRAMRTAIRDRVGLITFWGDYGGGKTLAMQIVLNELREGEHVLDGYYAPFPVVMDHLRSLFGQNMASSEYWERLLRVPILAIDEVTRFNPASDWQRDMLFVLADTRYRLRESHLTLFGTNDDPTVPLPTSDNLGYLTSRMREGVLVELRGDVRQAGGGS